MAIFVVAFYCALSIVLIAVVFVVVAAALAHTDYAFVDGVAVVAIAIVL